MVLSRHIAAFVALITAASASCLHGTSLQPRRLDRAGNVPVATFNYTGEGGPLHWVGLNVDKNKECGHGLTQSPIVIDSAIMPRVAKGALTLNIPSVLMADFENLGSTVEVIVNGSLNAQGTDYKLAQFHFHTPSEHRVDEEYSPMEIHFVFQSPSGSIAVVAFFVELSPYGRLNELLNQVFTNLHQISTPGSVTQTKRLDFAGISNHLHSNDVYTYMGSLTTPPCASKVTWYLSTVPITIDVATFNSVKRVIKYNSRYTQNTPGRANLMQIAAHDVGCNNGVRV